MSMPSRADISFLRYPFKNLGFMRFPEPVFAGIYQFFAGVWHVMSFVLDTNSTAFDFLVIFCSFCVYSLVPGVWHLDVSRSGTRYYLAPNERV